MSGPVHRQWGRSTRKSTRGADESPWIRRLLIGIALLFCGVFLLLPLANVFAQAFSDGLAAFGGAIISPDTVAAIRLTVQVANSPTSGASNIVLVNTIVMPNVAITGTGG